MPNDPFAKRPTDKPQLTREDLKTMHHLDIVEAYREGRVTDAAATPNPDHGKGYKGNTVQGTREPSQGRDWGDIVAARAATPSQPSEGRTTSGVTRKSGQQ